MLGAVAAGESAGGHASFVAAAAHMAALRPGRIDPDPARADLYDALYREYLELHDHFGRGGTAMMSRLRRLGH
jgi:L-ribulokinase